MSTAEHNQTQCPNCYAPKLPWQGLAFSCTDCGASFGYRPPSNEPRPGDVEYDSWRFDDIESLQ